MKLGYSNGYIVFILGGDIILKIEVLDINLLHCTLVFVICPLNKKERKWVPYFNNVTVFLLLLKFMQLFECHDELCVKFENKSGNIKTVGFPVIKRPSCFIN